MAEGPFLLPLNPYHSQRNWPRTLHSFPIASVALVLFGLTAICARKLRTEGELVKLLFEIESEVRKKTEEKVLVLTLYNIHLLNLFVVVFSDKFIPHVKPIIPRPPTRPPTRRPPKPGKGPLLTIHRSLVDHQYGLLTECEVKMAGYWPKKPRLIFNCLDRTNLFDRGHIIWTLMNLT